MSEEKENKCIFRMDYTSKEIIKIDVGQQIGCVALCENGDLLLAMQDGIYRMNKNGEIKLAHQQIPIKGRRFNDGKVGPDGCFYVGTTDENSMQPPSKERKSLPQSCSRA